MPSPSSSIQLTVTPQLWVAMPPSPSSTRRITDALPVSAWARVGVHWTRPSVEELIPAGPTDRLNSGGSLAPAGSVLVAW